MSCVASGSGMLGPGAPVICDSLQPTPSKPLVASLGEEWQHPKVRSDGV